MDDLIYFTVKLEMLFPCLRRHFKAVSDMKYDTKIGDMLKVIYYVLEIGFVTIDIIVRRKTQHI